MQMHKTIMYMIAHNSEIRHPAVIAPVTLPSEWIVLWPADLSSLWVLVSLEFWWRSSSDVWMQFLSIAFGIKFDCWLCTVLCFARLVHSYR